MTPFASSVAFLPGLSPGSRALPIGLLLLVGCAGEPPGSEKGPPIDTGCPGCDEDGDGFLVSGGDCDESDPEINPGAEEKCDDVDNDCDGDVDEDDASDASTWYADADGDGYGDDATEVVQCDGTGLVSVGGDCDDDDPAYNPGATEADCTDPNDYNCDGSVGFADADGDGYAACGDCDDGDGSVNTSGEEACNGIDDDCDGDVDEDDASDASTWYADADGDGYGDDATEVVQCDGTGLVAVGGDCDDDDPAYNPGATEADCTDPNDYNCDGSVGFADADGDGYAACEDCDDGDASVSPSGEEVCDGVDNDCDGDVDEDDASDASTWYEDADGDGYGDDATEIVQCDGTGLVAVGGDCDDDDASVSPEATETCDEFDVDEDCDGTSDDDDPDGASGKTTWWPDEDGDGYSWAAFYDHSARQDFCEDPGAGWVDSAGSQDCDDTDAGVSPVATETCNGIDDDCDGDVDEDDASDASTWYADADGDGYGDDATEVVQCDGTGLVADGGDCDDDDPAYNPGATEADCTDPNDYDCDGSVGYADADGDGYAACEDCDDTDADVSPDATETCNGIDDDCDGYTDTTAPESISVSDAYSSTANPNGDWSWGYADDAAATELTLYDEHVTDEAATGVEEWRVGGSGRPPSFGRNYTAADVSYGGITLPAGGMSLHPGPSGEYSVLRWTALEDAECELAVDFVGYDGATTAVAVYRSGSLVGSGTVWGKGSTASVSGTVYVAAGETLDFTVGPDGTYYSDTTGIEGTFACRYPPDDGSASDSHPDDDGDGFGDADTTYSACDAPADYLADGSDCDDTDADVSPDATETCNGIDDDCDGDVDEDDASDASTWYADGDGDGYGDPDSTEAACDQPGGYVENADDCDDSSSAAHPGAEEVCDDEDNDCDGTTNEAADGSLSFDGSDDEVVIADDSALELGSAFTFEAWVYPEDADDSPVLAKEGGDGLEYWFGTYYGGFGVLIGDATDADTWGTGLSATRSSGTISTGTWTHIATSWDGSTWTSYQEGVLVGSGSYAGTPPDTSHPVVLGLNSSWDSQWFTGNLRDVRIWNVARTEDEIRDNLFDLSDTSGLVAPWKLDEGSGQVAEDDSGNGLDGVLGDSTSADARDPTWDSTVETRGLEWCDGEDNDCDGDVDEDDASDASTWYEDADEDGYGDESSTIAACGQPTGYAELAGDCDDSDTSLYPGAPVPSGDNAWSYYMSSGTADGDDSGPDYSAFPSSYVGTVSDGETIYNEKSGSAATYGFRAWAYTSSALSTTISVSGDDDVSLFINGSWVAGRSSSGGGWSSGSVEVDCGWSEVEAIVSDSGGRAEFYLDPALGSLFEVVSSAEP